MKTCLDNASLIEAYVQGKISFSANRNLRVETIENQVHLLERNGKLLAIKDLTPQPITFQIRPHSNYMFFLQQALQNNHFAPDSRVDESVHLVRYRQCSVPPNYRLRFDESAALWKHWWSHYRNSRKSSLQLNLLLMVKQKWYPIRTIICDRGTLFIKTLIGEVPLYRTDIAIWLERDDTGVDAKKLLSRQQTLQLN